MPALKEKIERLKKVHYLASIFLFISTLCFCSYNAADLKLINISLSHYGISSKIGFFWNASLCVMAVTLLVEAHLNISKYSLHKWLYSVFIFAIICLVITAVVDMNHKVHFYTAYAYFIGYTLGIFLFGYMLIKTDFRIGITCIIIALISVIVPVGLTMYLHSFAIPEITHTLLIFKWTFIIRNDARYKNFLKTAGTVFIVSRLVPGSFNTRREELNPGQLPDHKTN